MAELSTLGAVIKTAYEGEENTNAFTDAEKEKLANTPLSFFSGAWADLTGIPAAISATTAAFTAALLAKLEGIQAGAQVNTINSDPLDIAGASQVINVVSMLREDYDALPTKDAQTLYLTDIQ